MNAFDAANSFLEPEKDGTPSLIPEKFDYITFNTWGGFENFFNHMFMEGRKQGIREANKRLLFKLNLEKRLENEHLKSYAPNDLIVKEAIQMGREQGLQEAAGAVKDFFTEEDIYPDEGGLRLQKLIVEAILEKMKEIK